MLKMIIADDESLVREGIRSIINWKEYGVEIMAEASSGKQTYELCKKLKPDILFTDIRMPFMNGLEVARKLKGEGLQLKVIIFSGFQEFNYAKAAVEVEADGYILKPLEVNELKEVINKVVSKIEIERSRENKFQQLREQLKENMAAASEKFFRSLLLGVYNSKEEIREKIQYFENPFRSDENIVTAVLTIDDYSVVVENYLEKDKQLLNFAVTNIVDEIIHEQANGICFIMNENQFVTIFNWKEDSLDVIYELFQKIVFELGKFLDISVSVGISRVITSVLNIPISFKECINALQYKFYTGKSSILSVSDISESINKAKYLDIYKVETELANAVKVGDILETEKITKDIFSYLKANNNYGMDYIKNISSEIILILSRTIYEAGEDIDDIVYDKFNILKNIQKVENIFELETYVASILEKAAEYFSKKYIRKNDKVISDIKNIISSQYMTEISVNKISKMIYLSPNYISLIFKKETGETITDYLTRIRIEKAKNLLKNTELQIQKISEMVGYEDASYFSKVFRKITGIHPLRYRSFIEVSGQ